MLSKMCSLFMHLLMLFSENVDLTQVPQVLLIALSELRCQNYRGLCLYNTAITVKSLRRLRIAFRAKHKSWIMSQTSLGHSMSFNGPQSLAHLSLVHPKLYCWVMNSLRQSSNVLGSESPITMNDRVHPLELPGQGKMTMPIYPCGMSSVRI